MTPYTNIVIIITIAVLISYLNFRFIKVQATTAILATSLLLSVSLVVLHRFGFEVVHRDVTNFVNQLHFQQILMNCMLGLLLFAGSISIDVTHFKNQKWEIATLSTFSVIVSTCLIGVGTYYLLRLLNLHLPMISCFLFGAMISPTDPIAVLATFKESKAPKKLSMLVAGESLFNDGVGVVIFLLLFHLAFSKTPLSTAAVISLFLRESLGGVGFGLALGILAYLLMAPIEDSKIEILITIALVTGGYTLAQAIGVSGPLAMVTAGIVIANHRNILFRSDQTQANFENFWELIDELLNAVLFLLTGAEILLIHFSLWLVAAALAAIPLTLLVRYLTVWAPMSIFKRYRSYPDCTIGILAWGGLRGGLAVALALALPHNGGTQFYLLPMTYTVVLFSILVQGTSIKYIVERCKKRWS